MSGEEPLLVILSGPSGAGKDTVLDGLRNLKRPWHFVVTATTRPKRTSEREGLDYIFLERENFRRWFKTESFWSTLRCTATGMVYRGSR